MGLLLLMCCLLSKTSPYQSVNTELLCLREWSWGAVTDQRREGRRLQSAGRPRVPGCSSSWCGKWAASCGRTGFWAAEPQLAALWPEPGRQRCPWWGWPTTSAQLSGESPGNTQRHVESRQLVCFSQTLELMNSTWIHDF